MLIPKAFGPKTAKKLLLEEVGSYIENKNY